MTDENESTIIEVKSNLYDKVKDSKGIAISDDVLAAAESLIADMSDSYLDWVKEDFVRLDEAFLKLAKLKDAASVHAVFEIAHDMKGQGGSFGYDLITAVGNSMCRFLEALEKKGSCNESVISGIKVYIDTMKLIINNRIKGGGGEMGKKLLEGCESIRLKLIEK